MYKKKLYDKVFKVDIKSRLTAKTVREELINKLLNPISKKEVEVSTKTKEFMDRFFKKYLEEKKDEILITGSGKDDVNEPMYRNYTGYTANIENNQIKSLKAHYYKRLY